jgi:hypothetical protein
MNPADGGVQSTRSDTRDPGGRDIRLAQADRDTTAERSRPKRGGLGRERSVWPGLGIPARAGPSPGSERVGLAPTYVIGDSREPEVFAADRCQPS